MVSYILPLLCSLAMLQRCTAEDSLYLSLKLFEESDLMNVLCAGTLTKYPNVGKAIFRTDLENMKPMFSKDNNFTAISRLSTAIPDFMEGEKVQKYAACERVNARVGSSFTPLTLSFDPISGSVMITLSL